MISRRKPNASSRMAPVFHVAGVTVALALGLVVYLAISGGWAPAAGHTIAAVVVLTMACAVLLLRQIKAGLDQPSEPAPVLLSAADWYLRLARRSGRPLGVIRAVAQVSDRGPAPQSTEAQDRALSRSLYEALRSVDLVAPIFDSDGAGVWIICPDTDAQGAQVVQQRLRHALADGRTSVRFGVTSFPEDGFTLDELFELAAKRASPGLDAGQYRETGDLLQSSGRATES